MLSVDSSNRLRRHFHRASVSHDDNVVYSPPAFVKDRSIDDGVAPG